MKNKVPQLLVRNRTPKAALDNVKRLSDAERKLLIMHYNTNLLDFVRDIICYQVPDNMIADDVHGPFCQMLQRSYWGTLPLLVPKKSIHGTLTLIPRECQKSTIGTIGRSVWILVQNVPGLGWDPPKSFNGKKGYNQRINIAHETGDESEKYLGSIANHFQRNEYLRDLYNGLDGDNVFWRKKTEGRWSSWELDIPWRDDFTEREANITTSSLRSTITGGHYDVTVWDDFFSELTMEEETGPDKVLRYYRNYIPVAHKPSILNVIGTVKDDRDLYNHIIRNEAHKWHILIEKSWRTPDDIANGKREFFYPAKLSREVLLDIRERMGSDYYSKEYQNEVVDPETAPFKARWFDEAMFDLPTEKAALEEWMSDKHLYVASDPAVADNKKSCLCTSLLIAVDTKGEFWIVDDFGQKGVGDDPTEYLDALFRQSTKYGPVLWTGVESVGLLKMVKWAADRRAKDTGVHLNWFELKPGGRSKEARIMGLRPLAISGGIHLQRHHQHILTEFLRYPRGRSRDYIDTIAYIPDMATIKDSVPKAPELSTVPRWKEGERMLSVMQRRGVQWPGMVDTEPMVEDFYA